jgi:1-deoxy-D-xylulose-5-phosphate synthase
MAPMNAVELRHMLYTAQSAAQGPVAIRYPRGYSENPDWEQPFERIPIGKARRLQGGSRIAILSFGTLGQHVARAIPGTDTPEAFGHFDFRFAKPLDTDLLDELCTSYEQWVTVEDGCLAGGFGSAVLEYLSSRKRSIPVTCLGIEDAFISHGTPEELYREQGLDTEGLVQTFNRL